MKTPALFLFFFSVTAIALSGCNGYGKYQHIDCKTVLNQNMYSAKLHDKLDQDSIINDYNILSQCGDLDSIDCEVFQGSVLGMILTDHIKKKGANQLITYQKCLDLIAQFKVKHKEEYAFFYKGILVRKEIEKLPVKLEEFDSIRPKLELAAMNQLTINEFKVFLDSYPQKQWTYKEAMSAFFNSQEAARKAIEPLEFPELDNLQKALDQSEKMGMNCLVYFSGYTTVNARKFEDQILVKPEIRSFIRKNYVYRIAYVDDRKNGAAYAKLQQEKFKSNSQPFLYILSFDGKIIAEWSYPGDQETFQEFLNDGIRR